MSIIAIGALGGSGTRAIAQVLIQAGIYMGDDLNQPKDNLIFTRLFKDPAWFQTASKNEISARLEVFKNYMEKDQLDFKDAALLLNVSLTNPTFRQNNILVIINLLRKMLHSSKNRATWGWKEPNTQIFIDEISEQFSNFKYIHVIRHGLDIAFSDNKQQLMNWGERYGISLVGNESESELAYKQMEYWVRSTKDAIICGKRLDDNFLLLNHSEFCIQPVKEIDRILKFLGLELGEDKLQELYKISKKPLTLDRYKKHNLKIFDKHQLDYVQELGFSY